MEFIKSLVSVSNDILWSYVLVVMLIALGLWFSFKTKFVQLRMIREMIRLLKEGVSHDGGHAHISSFQAFCISTASRVGVGNIAGIAIAIMAGGPGAIFWMWVIAVIGAASGFTESTLAQIYKVRDPQTFGFRGGPAYYYGESNIQFFSTKSVYLLIFRIMVVGMVAFGSVAELPFVWNLADLFMALMAIVNLIAITLLGRNAFLALKDYQEQKKAGVADPVFHPEKLVDRHGIEAWDNVSR